ncbi:hypothetical protein H0R92_08630 [Treponema sp. OMZ 840]|uniref:hypothetical protein n=1 Tax=Treponema sp. OMZ 840 TaxID=244313 RepID=UPI003D8A903F
MAKVPKKVMLELPLKVALSEEGAASFIRNKKKLVRLKMVDNSEESGVVLERFTPTSLQKLILLDYVSKIEISLPEFTTLRQDLIDLSKLLVFSLFYRQFSSQVQADLLATDVIKKHNRAHPGQFFDSKTKVPPRTLQSIMKKYASHINDMKRLILDPLNMEIVKNKNYSDEEKNTYLLMIEKFLSKLSPYNWYLIVLFSKQNGFKHMLEAVRKGLRDYMGKGTIAEYISLMFMEIASNCEASNMAKEAERLYKGAGESAITLYDPIVRKKIIAELTRKNKLVCASWKFGGSSASIGKQGMLQITVYNQDDEFQEVKESIETSKSADLNKKNLIDFYKELPQHGSRTDLGLYYLSYLNDACKQVNIKFDSHVTQFTSSDLTVINMMFNF